MREPVSQRILERLNQRKRELNLSYFKIAGLAKRRGFESCTGKKVWEIMNGQRQIRSREELVALAHALDMTAHELTTGLGEPGELVLIVGRTATATAKALPGTPATKK
jgi:hypothetical protein